MNNPHNSQDHRPLTGSPPPQFLQGRRNLNQESMAALLPRMSALGSLGSPNQTGLSALFPPDRQLSLNLNSEMNAMHHLRQLSGNRQSMMQPQPQQQLQNADLLRSYMGHKLQISMYEDQLRQRLMIAPTAPMLQPNVRDEAWFLRGQNPAGASIAHTSRDPLVLPSPHELSFRDDARTMRGGVIEPFPEKLHRLLIDVESAGRSDVISFIANGRAFAIHKPEKFFKEIVPQYFRQSRLSSFKRQLNLYGFELINTGPARGGYFHKLFIKDHPESCRRMRRVAVKLQSSQVGEENETKAPEFYSMPPVIQTTDGQEEMNGGNTDSQQSELHKSHQTKISNCEANIEDEH